MAHKETWKCVAWVGARSVGPTCVGPQNTKDGREPLMGPRSVSLED